MPPDCYFERHEATHEMVHTPLPWKRPGIWNWLTRFRHAGRLEDCTFPFTNVTEENTVNTQRVLMDVEESACSRNGLG